MFLFILASLHTYIIHYFAYVSLIIGTDSAPTTRNTPESKIINGIEDPINGNRTKLKHDAIICGKQILPLNSPRYVPMFLPFSAFVRIVNGKVIIAAHAIPINVKEITSAH